MDSNIFSELSKQFLDQTTQMYFYSDIYICITSCSNTVSAGSLQT